MSTKRSVDFLKQIANYISKSDSWDRVTQKLNITGGGEGKCIAELKLNKDHLDLRDRLHPGLVATIIDNVTTYALMSTPCHPGVSVDMQVSYMGSAKEGDEIVIDAKTVKAENNLAYIECELRRKSNGLIIVKGSQTKYYSE